MPLGNSSVVFKRETVNNLMQRATLIIIPWPIGPIRTTLERSSDEMTLGKQNSSSARRPIKTDRYLRWDFL